MCGLAGFWQPAGASAETLAQTVARMTDAIALRGPDDSGAWVDPEAGLALGFRRLAILDLSELGHQPKASHAGRYLLTFNGEIYNYMELRRELEALGAAFRGSSDTEVILAAFEQWGVPAVLPRLNGMFAIAVWDLRERRLTLARDPLGIKPMYVGRHAGTWFWGSELKALAAHPQFRRTLDLDALALYFRHGYVPGPRSIFSGISKLQPGHSMVLEAAGPCPDPAPFWSLQDLVARGRANPFSGSDAEAVDAVEAALRRSVGLQMVADVPLGAFLSGGIDSSLIVALMQAQSSRPVRTFSIGFKEDSFNEAPHARRVADHLGSDHTEWLVTAQDALDVIPQLAQVYDEPFADPAAVPTCLVSQLARRSVTVSLSGDGGDEVFGGYEYHISAQEGRLARALGRPAPVRAALGAGLSLLGNLLRPLPGGLAGHASEAFLHRARPHQLRDPVRYYRDNIADQLGRGGALLAARRDPDYLLTRPLGLVPPGSLTENFMFLDSLQTLPDEYLTKVDRATMSVSLEGRVPFLDTDLVELAWRLPMAQKIRNGQGKWVLRRVLERHVPAAIIDRPKHGFSVPIAAWLRGPLKPWAAGLLDQRLLAAQGLVDLAAVADFWDQHQAGRRNHGLVLWRLLMFQGWLQGQGGLGL